MLHSVRLELPLVDIGNTPALSISSCFWYCLWYLANARGKAGTGENQSINGTMISFCVMMQCTVCWHDQCKPAGDSCPEAGAAAWKQASSGGLSPVSTLACPLDPHCLSPHSFPFGWLVFGWICLPLGGLVSLWVVWSSFGWCGLPLGGVVSLWLVWSPLGGLASLWVVCLERLASLLSLGLSVLLTLLQICD